MRNSTAFEKTALLFGLALAELLRRVLKLHGFLDHRSHWLVRVIRTVVLLVIFSKTKMILQMVLGPLQGDMKYLPLVIQPVLFLVVFPLLLHVSKLGTFIGHVKHGKQE